MLYSLQAPVCYGGISSRVLAAGLDMPAVDKEPREEHSLPNPYLNKLSPGIILNLDIKQEGNDITILDHVVLALHSEEAFLASFGHTTTFHQVVITDYFRPDEAPFHISVDFTGSPESLGAELNRPCSDLG